MLRLCRINAPKRRRHPSGFSEPPIETRHYISLETFPNVHRLSARTKKKEKTVGFWGRLTVGASPQHFHLPACSHPQHCMSTLAAAILAGSRCPRRSHAIMHPRSHDSLNYTNRTGGCHGTAAHYIVDVQHCDLFLMSRYQVITEAVLWLLIPIQILPRYKMGTFMPTGTDDFM